jgi:RHS repeat-associated protein
VRGNSSYDWEFLYHGEFRDKESELYNYGYRYLDTQLGRWLSRDPVGEEHFVREFLFGLLKEEVDGLKYEESKNIYRFNENNPVNITDLYGLLACCKGCGECTIEKIHISAPTARIHVLKAPLCHFSTDPVGGCTDCLDFIENFNEGHCKALAKAAELAENIAAALGGATGMVVVYFGTYVKTASSDWCVGSP